MDKRDRTAKIVDEILRYAVGGGVLAIGLFVPNIMIALRKPLNTLLHTLDDREKEREVRRIITNLKSQGYLAGEYEHGLQVTEKAKQRLAKNLIANLRLQPQNVWDKKWRIIIYDIPEKHQLARQSLVVKLHRYGCFQLQKSTWITPFPCRDDIIALTSYYDVQQYVSYFEAINLDNDTPLIARFRKKYPNTAF